MKSHFRHGVKQWVWAILLWGCLWPVSASAQGGITVYSDTTSALADTPQDSAWNSQANGQTTGAPFPTGFQFDEDFLPTGIWDFLTNMMGLTGFVLVLFAIVLFLSPLLAVALLIYLIYRSERRKRQEITQAACDPANGTVDKDLRDRLLLQSAIRKACWGAGLIVGEWVLDLTDLLYFAGIVMLCLAAGDWAGTLLKKK